jgi:hypothetical protein
LRAFSNLHRRIELVHKDLNGLDANEALCGFGCHDFGFFFVFAAVFGRQSAWISGNDRTLSFEAGFRPTAPFLLNTFSGH